MSIFVKKIFSSVLILLFCACAICAESARVKIACVGDSITAGSGIRNAQIDSYPSVLAELLGANYDVKNFGVSGRTLMDKGDNPYRKERKFEELMKFAPQIVILKLGTNDAKPQNWVHKAGFKGDMLAMISQFQALESKPEIYLCTPMYVAKDGFGISGQVVKNEIAPLVREIAKEKKLKLIDFYMAFDSQAEILCDGIHPNEEGALKMARMVYKSLKNSEAPELPKYRGNVSVQKGFDCVEFPFQGRSISVILPKKFDAARSWVWQIAQFKELAVDDEVALNNGKVVVYADSSIWLGCPISMSWGDKFYDYLRYKFDLSEKSELNAKDVGAIFALRWAQTKPDRVSKIKLSDPICDLYAYPDRNDAEALKKMTMLWRISIEEIASDANNPLKNLQKLKDAGVILEIDSANPKSHAKILREALGM